MTPNEMRVAVARAIYETECSGPFDEAPRIDRNLAMDAADAAIRAMDRTDVMAFVREVVPLLEGALDTLEAAAKKEKRLGESKALKPITQQKRYEAAQALVDRGWRILEGAA